MGGGRFQVSVGMDLSFGMLQAAARQLAPHQKTHLTRASATELPFASQSFDAISTMGVAECVGPLDVMLRECHRVLSPGGLLVMTCGHGCCLAKRLGAKLRAFCKRVKRLGRAVAPSEVSIHQRSPETLDRIVTEAGFLIRERVFRGVRLFGWPLKDWCPGITYGLEDRVETWPLLRRFKWTAAVYAVCAERV
jgi:SAM-dependent methyltransferase